MNNDMLGFIARQAYLDDIVKQAYEEYDNEPEFVINLPDDVTEAEAAYIEYSFKELLE